MTTLVHPATSPSVTDPYTPEPSNTAPVRLRLTYAGTPRRVVEVVDDARVLTPHLLLRRGGVLFIARGETDGVRLYREAPVLDLDTPGPTAPAGLNADQKEAVVLAKRIADWDRTGGADAHAAEYHAATARRTALLLALARAEIQRISGEEA